MKRFLVFFICLCSAFTSFAQELPSKCTAFLPRLLLESKVLEESKVNAFLQDGTFGQNDMMRDLRYWMVYSDRAGNTTYTTPGGSQKFATLEFNEPLRIASISGHYALVYSEPNKSMIYPQISDDAVCRGWVDMNNLLLWDTCLANERGIYFKAMLCINADEHNSSTTFGLGYRNPKREDLSFKLSTDMKFYFIMKRMDDGKSLLATQHTMNGKQSDKVLYAWVGKDSYVPWNQRSCIEPNWDHEAVEHFAKKSRKVQIYDNKQLTGMVACTVPFKISTAEYDPYQYRMAPNALRFPILDGTNDLKYECSSFTSADGGGALNAIAEVDQKKVQALEKLQAIRLMIVIDGTKSMDKYFPAVRNAIIKGCQYFDREKYDLKVGVMIYRDYADGEKNLIEMRNFRDPNDPILHKFLETGGLYGIKSAPSDKSYTEALYYGMNSALDNFTLDPSQSNLMLVIGDCGNALNDTKVSQQEIVNKLVQKNVNLVGYQVRNFDIEAWNLFNNQILTMIKKSMDVKFKKLNPASRVRSKISNDGQVFYNTMAKQSDLYVGAHKYATTGTEISADVLTDLMTQTIRTYSASVQHQLDLLIQGVQEPESVAFTADVDKVDDAVGMIQLNNAWLKNILGDEAFKSTKGNLVSFRGWTAKKDDADYEFFKPVIFISVQEFDELLMRLKPLKIQASKTSSSDRKPYVDAVKGLLGTMAPGMSAQEMDAKSIDEVMNMISGLNAKSVTLSDDQSPSLQQISDELAVSAADYRTLVSNFERKYDILTQLKSSTEYKYFREFNGAKYYWIPVEFLP